jgi:RNA polymerase sigma-70 factor (ECF subfamily)
MNHSQAEVFVLHKENGMKVTPGLNDKWHSPRLGRVEEASVALSGHARLGDIVSEHLDALYSYALVLSRNPADAEDLIQETCARAIRAMGSLREDSNVKSWLFTILRNIWLNQLRQQRTRPRLVELDVDHRVAGIAVETSADPLTSYLSKVEREQVRRAIQQLPTHFREVIVLREFEDLSYEEIAGLLNCPAGTVMSRLARARSRLRELLISDNRKPAVQDGPAG